MDHPQQVTPHLIHQLLPRFDLPPILQGLGLLQLFCDRKILPTTELFMIRTKIYQFKGLTKASGPHVKIDVYDSRYTLSHFFIISSPLTVMSLQSPKPKPIINNIFGDT